jgi:mRNA-degrading endonuclease RelE of RelBE toxin-antitoxin system
VKISVKKTVWKDVERVPKHIQLMVSAQIKKLEFANSLSEMDNVRRLKGTNEPYYRLKFNDYRLLLYYDEVADTVNVRALNHRKDAYKKQNLPWIR